RAPGGTRGGVRRDLLGVARPVPGDRDDPRGRLGAVRPGAPLRPVVRERSPWWIHHPPAGCGVPLGDTRRVRGGAARRAGGPGAHRHRLHAGARPRAHLRGDGIPPLGLGNDARCRRRGGRGRASVELAAPGLLRARSRRDGGSLHHSGHRGRPRGAWGEGNWRSRRGDWLAQLLRARSGAGAGSLSPFARAESLTVRHVGRKRPAFRDFDLEWEEGERLLLLGPSGSGKSTLALCLDGVIPHALDAHWESGSLTVAGRDTRAASLADLASTVGVLFQDPETQLVMLDTDDEIAFGLENLEVPREAMRERIAEARAAAGLGPDTPRRLDALSGGAKQRAALARLLGAQRMLRDVDEAAALLLERWPRAMRPARERSAPGRVVLGAREVAYRYRGADRDAIAGISLEFRRGEIAAIVGANG